MLQRTVTDTNWSYRVNWKFDKEPKDVAEEMKKLITNVKSCFIFLSKLVK